jgi:hypothetical protein
MKRCPQCDFIYFDTDEVCDLDGAKLVHVDEAELRLEEKPPKRARKRMVLVAAVGGVLLGAVMVAAYLGFARIRQQTRAQTPLQQVQQNLPTPVSVAVAPTPEPSPSLEPSPTPSAKTPQQSESPKRTAMSKDPVSTSATDTLTSGQVWIKLSNGARIEADEVWRTKEGVWYRRNGVVTLIKASRVRAIEKAKH